MKYAGYLLVGYMSALVSLATQDGVIFALEFGCLLGIPALLGYAFGRSSK